MKYGNVLFAVIVGALSVQGCGPQGAADPNAGARVETESRGSTEGTVASAAAEVLTGPVGASSESKTDEPESIAPDLEIVQADTLVIPGEPIEIVVRATSDVNRIALSDGIHDSQAFVRDSGTNVWRATYRVPLRSRHERWGLSVTAKNPANRWSRVWVFVHAEDPTPAVTAEPDTAAVSTP